MPMNHTLQIKGQPWREIDSENLTQGHCHELSLTSTLHPTTILTNKYGQWGQSRCLSNKTVLPIHPSFVPYNYTEPLHFSMITLPKSEGSRLVSVILYTKCRSKSVGGWPRLSQIKCRNAWAFPEIAGAYPPEVYLNKTVKVLLARNSSRERSTTEVTGLTRSLSLDHSRKGQT